VNAFWSLTMYDPESHLVPNTINRYALGDRSGLAKDDDGSLTLYKLALRLYSPEAEGRAPLDRPPRGEVRPANLRPLLRLDNDLLPSSLDTRARLAPCPHGHRPREYSAQTARYAAERDL
jgi:hypothetical protein